MIDNPFTTIHNPFTMIDNPITTQLLLQPATGLANIDPNCPPNRAQRVRQGRNSFVYLLDRRPIRFDNKTWRYNSDNQPVSEDEFWTPQTRGRPLNDSVEHNQKFYWQKQELYFDQSTDHWRTEDGNHPAPDEGNPDEHVPEELRTPPTPVAGPSNPEPVQTRPSFSANVESSDEEGNTSGTSEEFVDADQSTELEYVEQEQPEETEQNQDESSSSSEEEQQPGTGAQTVTHITPLPPLQIALPPLPLSPPLPPSEPSSPETPDVEMSQATAPQNNYQGGGGAKLPLPEDFVGVRSKCTGFLASIRAYFNFYPNQFATDAQKITLALMSCKGAASTWRDSKFAKFDTDPISHGTWTEFRTRFINQWEEVSAMASAMIKIQKLKLGGKYNMTQLISRFDELIPYCKIQDNEPMKIHFFNQCFPDNIKTHILLKSPTTYDE
ncbi:hypothetical protein M378DRAFT_18885 [Amanita muscaria Koide BX008]|uniref:Retrotransposon gag domain-containing protein n=1 Tax=Amanita muscaria (strain Koide BX008) TaxID=946122 RepID=A0A0C2W011_AMAMK|nr:hypothetical protein M378DRAFT_18885 [Amanita muscaria Koide BX008]